ncbi:MAG: 4-alpha-glucanotransferase [Candidatus Entotheonellia bacterium]
MMRTDHWGIDDGYEDAMGNWHETSMATRLAILTAMGADAAGANLLGDSTVQVLRPGQAVPLDEPAELWLEDGTVLQVNTTLPPDLPLGYHDLHPLDGGPTIHVIVSPSRCYCPAHWRIWGWAVQLYALRSAESWGIGDLVDLRRLARWSAADLGTGILLMNPLHAATPVLPQQPSPYFPSSRCYRNLLYLRVEEVPGATEAGIDLENLAETGRALNRNRQIDRDAIFRLKMHALEHLWSRFGGDTIFERYCTEQGDALSQFAVFCVLAEHYGRDWHAWPSAFCRPDSLAVAHFAADRADRVRFYQWLQWLLDEQLARAAAELALMQDLPIGVDPTGADAWAWQDVLATDATVGVPPDKYNTLGQDWGLPPFVPYKLRAAGYEPFRQTIRANLRHAGGLRIDHVMGLFRLFWIPRGADPGMGAFVRYPADELLAIVALESHRAKALVVGEDLGTVEEGVQAQLAAHRILSYRLLWFETALPSHYPELALAAITTHDLPTIAGLWSGADLRIQQELGLQPNEEGLREIREHLQKMTGLPERAAVQEVIVRAYQLLAEAPSMVVTATLEDAMAVEERPNIPTTTTEWANWSIALPAPLEALQTNPLVHAIGKLFKRRRPR